MDKKEQIIEIATKLFSERGFENTPISVISEQTNVSKGLISHHFKSKDGLLREIFIKTTKLIIEINLSKQTDLNPREQILELLESFFSQLKEDKMFFQFSLNTMLQPNTRKVLNDLIGERSSFILNSVKDIFEKIDPKNALIMSYMFIAKLDGIAINYLVAFDEYPLNLVKEHLLKKYKSI